MTEDVGTALSRVIVAGQRVLGDRVELAIHEGRQSLHQAALGVTLVALGGIVLLGALVAVDLALVEMFGRGNSRSEAMLVCAVIHGVIGGALLYFGLRKREAR